MVPTWWCDLQRRCSATLTLKWVSGCTRFPSHPDGPIKHLELGTWNFGTWNERLAEREGFEPSVQFPVHTLSKRAP